MRKGVGTASLDDLIRVEQLGNMGPVTSLLVGVLDILDEEGRVLCEDFSTIGVDTHVAVHCFPVHVIHYYVTVGHVTFSL